MDDDRVMVIFNLMIGDHTEPKRVCSFRTKHFAEWLKMLHYCKKHEIDMWPHDGDEQIPEDIAQKLACGSYVDDVCVVFGSEDVIQCIEVTLK